MKLTKEMVEKAPLPDKGQTFIWDSELRGFGVRLNPGGRTYIVQSRVKGRTRRVSIGRHGVLTVQEARKKAQTELAKMLNGVDPVMEKAKEEAFSMTLRKLSEQYISDRRDLKKTSIKDIHKHIMTSFATWADRPAVEITRDKVAVLFRELSEKGPAQANQAFRILRALLNYAKAAYRPDGKPIILENPVDILSDAKLWNRIQPRSGRVPTNKVGVAWNTIQAEREAPGQSIISRTLADIAAFLLLTGARWSEAAGLTWDRVNLDEKWWYLPDPKNRNPVTLPLSDVAVEILSARPRTGTFVFPKRSGAGHVVDGRGIMSKISEAAGVQLSAHDLRRTFRAVAGECGIELYKCKLLMNHRLSGDVTINSYTETSDIRYLAPEINQIAEWIQRQGVIASKENVVPFIRKEGQQ
jgi:integrase